MPVTDWAKPTTATSSYWLPYSAATLADGIHDQDVTLPDYTWDVPHIYSPNPWSTSHIVTIGGFETSTGVALAVPALKDIVGIECSLTCAPNGGLGFVECDPVENPEDPLVCHYPAITSEISKDGLVAVGDPRSRDLNYGGLDFTLGSAVDLWGTTWTAAEINAGIYFFVYPSGETSTTNRLLDYYWVRVWYASASGPPAAGTLCEDSTRYIPGLSIKGNPSLKAR